MAKFKFQNLLSVEAETIEDAYILVATAIPSELSMTTTNAWEDGKEISLVRLMQAMKNTREIRKQLKGK